jgi:hypothetical protein
MMAAAIQGDCMAGTPYSKRSTAQADHAHPASRGHTHHHDARQPPPYMLPVVLLADQSTDVVGVAGDGVRWMLLASWLMLWKCRRCC